MTAYSSTISEAVNVFGPATADKWDVFNWNAFLWGYGTQTLPKNVVHLIDPSAQQITSTDAVGKLVTKTIQESQVSTLTFSGVLMDPNGFDYVFPENVTAISQISKPTWTAVSPAAPTWSSLTATSTSWTAL